jgi:hypothetical protein
MRTLKDTWIVDGTIDVGKACEDSGWHIGSAIVKLMQQGLKLADAEAYVNFVFAEAAGEGPEIYVNDDQWWRMMPVTRRKP